MKRTSTAQLGFSSLFFDTLFGLVLFFGIDSFLEIKSLPHFALYFFSTIILIHWWLIFKSTDDLLKDEVSNSLVDILFGVIEVLFVDHIILFAKSFDYQLTTACVIGLFCTDLLWALTWRYLGRWQLQSAQKIKAIEDELDHAVFTNVGGIILFCLLFFLAAGLSAPLYISLFLGSYALYMIFTFRGNLIYLRFF